MRDKREMTFEELLDELKRMKHQMRNFSAIQKENNRLDAEYYHITKMQKKGVLDLIEIPDAD